MIINKSVCSAKRSFRKGSRGNPIERVSPLRLCILSSYKERMCRVQGGISACIGIIGALLAIIPTAKLRTEYFREIKYISRIVTVFYYFRLYSLSAISKYFILLVFVSPSPDPLPRGRGRNLQGLRPCTRKVGLSHYMINSDLFAKSSKSDICRVSLFANVMLIYLSVRLTVKLYSM